MPKSKVEQVENYARETLTKEVAHDFKHVDRVRNWALRIAKEESYEDTEVVEITALLHDIGLAYTEKRSEHAEVGAEVAAKYLRENGFFSEEIAEEIAEAIRYHGSLEDRGELQVILKDADMLDALGAVGIMRAFTSKSWKPEYEERSVKGETWGFSARGFDGRIDNEGEVGDYIIDQINFQISYYENLKTETAKRLAGPLVKFMKDYVLQMEREIEGV
jgi:putative nucleotidyltransferase with HDIG domain